MPIGDLLFAAVVELFVVGVVGQIEQEPLRFEALAHRIAKTVPVDDHITGRHHLVGAEPVQVREGNLANQLSKGILGLVAERLDVLEMIENVPTVLDIFIRQVRQARLLFDLAAGVDPKLALQLRGNRVFQQLAALGDTFRSLLRTSCSMGVYSPEKTPGSAGGLAEFDNSVVDELFISCIRSAMAFNTRLFY